MKWMLILNFIVLFVMILVGSNLKSHPAPDMDRHNGYNTRASRKSKAHWDYAQSIAPDIFIFFGKVLLAAEAVWCGLTLIADFNSSTSVGFGTAIGFIFMIIAFWKTDKTIQNRFTE